MSALKVILSYSTVKIRKDNYPDKTFFLSKYQIQPEINNIDPNRLAISITVMLQL
jgi:hypothetical protein